MEAPFGGPRTPPSPMCALPNQRGRRLAGQVEVRFELLRDDLAAYFHIGRDGGLNHLDIVPYKPSDLASRLDSLKKMSGHKPDLVAWVQDRPHTWSFTEWRPVLGHMRVGRQEFLLMCPDVSAAVILAHSAGHLQATEVIDMHELRHLNLDRLLEAPTWPNKRRSFGRVGASPRTNTPPTPARADVFPTTGSAGRDHGPPPPAGGAPPSSRPTSTSPSRTTEADSRTGFGDAGPAAGRYGSSVGSPPRPPVTPSSPAPVAPRSTTSLPPDGAVPGSSPVVAPPANPSGASSSPPQPTASSPLPSPQPAAATSPPRATEVSVAPAASGSPSASASPERDPPDPVKPAKLTPQFLLSADASPKEIKHHFKVVEEAIPPLLIGSATAVELWKAFHEALNHGVLPITGKWIDLVSELHRHGFLSHIPSDRASRAALLILEKLSPLVRRLHRRRWVVGLER